MFVVPSTLAGTLLHFARLTKDYDPKHELHFILATLDVHVAHSREQYVRKSNECK